MRIEINLQKKKMKIKTEDKRSSIKIKKPPP